MHRGEHLQIARNVYFDFAFDAREHELLQNTEAFLGGLKIAEMEMRPFDGRGPVPFVYFVCFFGDVVSA